MSSGAYKKGTPLSVIVVDGWTGGFSPKQTMMEARKAGYIITRDHLLVSWAALDQVYSSFIKEGDV